MPQPSLMGRLRSVATPIDLSVTYEDGRANLAFHGTTAYLECAHPAHKPPEVHDFTAFLAAIVSARTGRIVRVRAPVSERAASNLERIGRMFACWRVPGLSTPQVETPTIVPIATAGPEAAILLSGGVDSTYAALARARAIGARHAILVHGADYRLSDAAAFDQLRERVNRIASYLGLDLIVVRTDFREFPFDWEMLHGIFFAAVLHFVGPAIGRAVFALDNAIWQDPMRHPWGSNLALAQAFSGSALEIEPAGWDVERFAKTVAIARHPELVAALSVCYADRSTGGNCGTCTKCVRTRLALAFAGVDIPAVFHSETDLVDALSAQRVPRRSKSARGYYVRMEELYHAAPEGDLKDILAKKVALAHRFSRFAAPSGNPARALAGALGDLVANFTSR